MEENGERPSYAKSAEYYDALCSSKDYAGEASHLHRLLQQHRRKGGNRLLEVACGTGGHIRFLRDSYLVEGLDVDADMLRIARQRYPEIAFHQGDMASFDLGRRFDVVACLGGSVAYVRTVSGLRRAIRNMRNHLLPGGVLFVEPWFKPGDVLDGSVGAHFVDQPDFKIACMSVNRVRDAIAEFYYHYLVATSRGIEHFTERHRMGLFTHEEYLAAFEEVGLETHFDDQGLMGRGAYIGISP